jgi:YidC/Oxa1 family membrane protein insertase
MDKVQLILWAVLLVFIMLNVRAWQKDYGLKSAGSPPQVPSESSAIISVSTDVLNLAIDLRGGAITTAELSKYTVGREGSGPMLLLDPGPLHSSYESGLIARAVQTAPSTKSPYLANRRSYQLADGDAELRVPLTWTNHGGVTISKTFILKRGSYLISIIYEVNNESNGSWSGASYAQLLRQRVTSRSSIFKPESLAYTGPAIYDGHEFKKLDLEKTATADVTATATAGWVAALQRHFVVALIPDNRAATALSVQTRDQELVLRTTGTAKTIPAGTAAMFTEQLFVGPKLHDQLSAATPTLELSADYGRLSFIARPLFWLLDHAHRLVGNWGAAIMLVTLLIKAAFFQLTAISARSAAKFRRLTPQLRSIDERFAHDKEALKRAKMELYQREKLNPFASCLPALIQAPVFMAFYYVLRDDAEFRQAPLIGWIHDLSAGDPLFILPAVLALSMLLAARLNPPVLDPAQATVQKVMPMIWAGMMAWAPAGLVLYQITNTVLTAAQQWRLNQLVGLA